MRVHNDIDRALMVILQSHRTQNMILRCYPNVSLILWRHTKYRFLCFFQQSLYFPLLIHRMFYLLLCSFFTCSIRREHSSQSFAPPKNGYLVWSRGASSAHAGRAQAQNIAAAYFLSCRVQSAEHVATRDSPNYHRLQHVKPPR